MEVKILASLPQSTAAIEPRVSWFVEAKANATKTHTMEGVEYVIERVRITDVAVQHVRYGTDGTVSTYLHHSDPATVEARKRVLNWIIGQFADRRQSEWLQIIEQAAQGQVESQFVAAEKTARLDEERSRLLQHEAVAA